MTRRTFGLGVALGVALSLLGTATTSGVAMAKTPPEPKPTKPTKPQPIKPYEEGH